MEYSVFTALSDRSLKAGILKNIPNTTILKDTKIKKLENLYKVRNLTLEEFDDEVSEEDTKTLVMLEQDKLIQRDIPQQDSSNSTYTPKPATGNQNLLDLESIFSSSGPGDSQGKGLESGSGNTATSANDFDSIFSNMGNNSTPVDQQANTNMMGGNSNTMDILSQMNSVILSQILI
jgi:hypothetical protein